MNLTLCSSLPEGDTPTLLALQDELLAALPTVFVCPLKAGMELTAIRMEVPWKNLVLVACPELTRRIRRTLLRPLGTLNAHLSAEVMQRFLLLLAQEGRDERPVRPPLIKRKVGSIYFLNLQNIHSWSGQCLIACAPWRLRRRNL